jgi:hypothetical protein
MKKINLIIILLTFLINNFFFSNLLSQINSSIVIKVGQSLITSIDIQNEIITNLTINKQQITQVSIDSSKQYAIKNLINKTIKREEIEKYEIKNYSQKDLQNYITGVAKNLNTDPKGLEEVFKQAGLNYKVFIESYKTELLWNTLIYKLYKNQMNINIIEVENEIKNMDDGKDEKKLETIKKNLLNQRKQEKLNLFSRSHFSNLENTIDVNFQ